MPRIAAPKKLYEAIRLAVADVRLIEKDKRYKIEMETWHDGLAYEYDYEKEEENGEIYKPCGVCFAGSVMAKTLNAPVEDFSSPQKFPGTWHKTFYALDYLRIGDIGEAIRTFYGTREDGNARSDKGIFELMMRYPGAIKGYFPNDAEIPDLQGPRYNENPAQFKRNMLKVAKILEKVDL